MSHPSSSPAPAPSAAPDAMPQDPFPTDAATAFGPGVDPGDMAVFLRVAEQVTRLETGHPDMVAARRATSGLYKLAKKFRRDEKRREELAHDAAIIAATATGSPGRIDDETQGLLPSSAVADRAVAGTLLQPQPCYVCKKDFTQVDWFYHQLCPECAVLNHAKREARTDLTGRRALLTGGRAKIGMYIALRLLRDGADLTITTRFPRDAARRFAAMEDSADWLHRLTIVGIDLRDPAQVVALADEVAARGPLDILVNNAAQTVRRSPAPTRPWPRPSCASCRATPTSRPSRSAGPAPRTPPCWPVR
ncbi:SDR family NAD(P)-dependent oxidoreductase [Litorihabitans aurantiacus]|uniref:Short chain dehydrogenase n=1 Tax=Litorihabitans aurantiacus TaxID=1930061 RepID=A0AA37XDX3_9MICO|nr:SDR family NAD(P)-dependent oxidoreductase [Litorihabitans aurantiacus]GMA31394.1 hypothetical protein GCM10025875_13860 [Litorihabitans aurantiacus]